MQIWSFRLLYVPLQQIKKEHFNQTRRDNEDKKRSNKIMRTTIKELRERVNSKANIYIGEIDNRKTFRFSLRKHYRSMIFSAVYFWENLPISDSTEVDAYSKVEVFNEIVEGPFDFNSKNIYICIPSFVSAFTVAYKRKYKFCVNDHVLRSVSAACREWIVRTGYLSKKNKAAFFADIIVVDYRTNDKEICEKAVNRTITFAKKAFAKYLQNEHLTEDGYLDRISSDDARKSAEKKRIKAAAKARQKEMDYIHSHIMGNSTFEFLFLALNTGKNSAYYDAKLSKSNGVECQEKNDWNGYSKSCQYPMVERTFTLNLKKGYKVAVIGGLITFYRGAYSRLGMSCEWVEQGRAIADLKTVKGYLVRGEHIIAKSLNEARRINAENRKHLALSLLDNRAKIHRKLDKMESYMFTFEDSVKSGNCRPGTQSFKQRVEAEIGHEINEISLADLRKYGKKFGLELYTNRVINYVANHI